jgi:hypothetical protein
MEGFGRMVDGQARPDLGGFDRAAARWRWPEDAALQDVEPFEWSLDGGGRELIQRVIDERPEAVLLEIGSFMGGAVRRWLRENPRLRCVAVDPWGANLVPYVHNLVNVDWAVRMCGVDQLRAYGKALDAHGPLSIVRNNLYEFRDRCVLVQAGVPEVFGLLSEVGLRPDIVFLDALKVRAEFTGAHETFPDAIITGDDWSWKDKSGDCPVRRFALEVAALRRAQVFAHRATFIIAEERHGLTFDPKFLYSPP